MARSAILKAMIVMSNCTLARAGILAAVMPVALRYYQQHGNLHFRQIACRDRQRDDPTGRMRPSTRWMNDVRDM